jgi:trk system potassium uptake protein TrkH
MKSLKRVLNKLNPLDHLHVDRKENRRISGGGTKIILKQIGNLLILLGFILLVPTLVSLLYSEWYSTLGFIMSAIIIFALGFLLLAIFRKTPEPHFNHSFLVVAWGWLAMTFAGGLPFFLISVITPQNIMNGFIPEGVSYSSSSLLYFRNYLHCFFESMSAYTTTGLTMAVHEPSVGKGILFYRSFAQWIGGAGFIIMVLAVFRYQSGHSVRLLYSSESTGINLRSKVMDTAKGIWKSYAIITSITALFLILGTWIILPDYPLKDNLFDSINHALAGLSSGGFSTLDDSIATYKSEAMDYLYLVPMMLGSFSLPFYYRIFFKRKFNEIWKDVQTRSLLICFVIGSLILSLLLWYSKATASPFREGIFQYISGISTTGWQTSNIHVWDDRSFLFIIFFGMFIGGAWGGTVGGIKIYRAVFILKGMLWNIRKSFYSQNTFRIMRFDEKVMLPEQINSELASASVFAILFFIIFLVSTIATTFFLPEGFSFFDAMFESIAAQSTAGLTVGITDPSMNPVVESIYIFQMWVGRLEIFPVLALFRAIVKGTNPYR